MKTSEIQKQLNDFKCFKNQFKELCVTVLDAFGDLIYQDIIDPASIFVLAGNPYQLNIVIQEKERHGTIYHLDENAQMDLEINRACEGYVSFKDKNHNLIFAFLQEDWKDAEQWKA